MTERDSSEQKRWTISISVDPHHPVGFLTAVFDGTNEEAFSEAVQRLRQVGVSLEVLDDSGAQALSARRRREGAEHAWNMTFRGSDNEPTRWICLDCTAVCEFRVGKTAPWYAPRTGGSAQREVPLCDRGRG